MYSIKKILRKLIFEIEIRSFHNKIYSLKRREKITFYELKKQVQKYKNKK